MRKEPIHIVFAGGGTAGHLFPGLAVAEQLSAMIPRVRITFCGSDKAFERKAVAEAGFDYFALSSRPFPRVAREAVSFVVENLAGYMAAKRFLREERVAAVVGLGGYVSVPMGRAAIRRDVPLVLLEQNAIPGRATRWLARGATLVCTAFEEASAGLRCRCPIRVTGNPIRFGFDRDTSLTLTTIKAGAGEMARHEAAIDCQERNVPFSFSRAPEGSGFLHSPHNITSLTSSDLAEDAESDWALKCPARETPGHQLLILGGSGGARSLNENVPRALYKIRSQLDGWRIVHQSGQADLDATKTLYRKLDLPATVVSFVGDMPSTLRATDLAICRAGGTTLPELAAAAVPAVLLPYPLATDDHQAANARHFSTEGGCVTIDEREISDHLDDRLADVLCFLLANEALRKRMSLAIHALARPTAARDVAELVWSIISSRSLCVQTV
jgi:UDP-N-acetylglucosamine--N-acetylmuramyl-(pentapeptide) pyrophosphoryl-undecaprenol N-acetylglucosamine transferase